MGHLKFALAVMLKRSDHLLAHHHLGIQESWPPR